jgi:PPOX class probable F420-dependent enzyme
MTELLSDDALAFVTERHLATLSTLSPSGRIHVVAVGFSYRDGIARVITSGESRKVANVLADGRASISQVDSVRWLTLQGTATIARSPEEVQLGVDLYAERYRQPRVNPLRVVIELSVEKVLGSSGMRRVV